MTGHEQDSCFVAQRLPIERLAGFLIARIEQMADDGNAVAPHTPPIVLQDAIQHVDDAADRATYRRPEQARQSARQAQEGHEIDRAHRALVFAEAADHFLRIASAEFPTEQRAADDLGGQLCHLTQGVDDHRLLRSREAVSELECRLDHDGRKFWQT